MAELEITSSIGISVSRLASPVGDVVGVIPVSVVGSESLNVDISQSVSTVPDGLIGVQRFTEEYDDLGVGGEVSVGLLFKLDFGVAGKTYYSTEELEAFSTEDVVAAGFLPDAYTIKEIARLSGVRRRDVVEVLNALRNLLVFAKDYSVSPVYCFSFRLRLVKVGNEYYYLVDAL